MGVVTAIGSSIKLGPQQLRAASLFDAMETKAAFLQELQSLLPNVDASAAREVHGVIRSNTLAIQNDFAAIAGMRQIPAASREDARAGALALEPFLEHPGKLTLQDVRAIQSGIYWKGNGLIDGLRSAADQAVAGAQ